MSDGRILVCFLDQASSLSEHREHEKNLLRILLSAAYDSCLVCYAGSSGRSSYDDFFARLKGATGSDFHPLDIGPSDDGECALADALEGDVFRSALSSLGEADYLIGGLSLQSRRSLSRLARRGLIRGRWLREPGRAYPGSGQRVEGLVGKDISLGKAHGPTRVSASSSRELCDATHPGMDAKDLEQLIERVIRYDDVGVLIQGESGTGKTRLARRIHAEGPRRRGTLVEVNCGCIPAGMIESELFGHVRGAYTGATAERLGKIRSADGGILFLDEVGELGLDMQVRLLKVLEDRVVTPLGSERSFRVDVRVVAASNRDLMDMVRSGSFRFDLYNRLNQIAVRLPPIRERTGEILRLARETIRDWNLSHGEGKRFTNEALSAMEACPWPGNYRQLIHAVHCACVRAEGEEIGERHLPLELGNCEWKNAQDLPAIPEGGVNLKELMSTQEWSYYRQALLQSGWRPGWAARLLGMTGHAFRKALRERYADRYQEMMRESGVEEA